MQRYKRAINGEIEQLRNDVNVGNEKSDKIALDELEDDYYNVIGYGEKFHRLHGMKNKRALLQADYVIKDKKFNLNLIRILDGEIAQLEKNMSGGMDIDEVKAKLDKYFGYTIDLNKETVLSFHKKIKEYERA